jgi:hypothetical protein
MLVWRRKNTAPLGADAAAQGPWTGGSFLVRETLADGRGTVDPMVEEAKRAMWCRKDHSDGIQLSVEPFNARVFSS